MQNQSEMLSVPQHIAIIMDGNGRWAKQRGLPRNAGHRQGAKVFETICDYCQKIGVKYVTAYAFSTENWKRPQNEVDAIMDLLRSYLKEAAKQVKRNVCLRFLGDRTPLAPDVQELIEQAERESAANTGITVCIALNYGGRAEIVHSARALAEKAAKGQLDPARIDEGMLAENLYSGGIPDPDLMIRPSGEKRLSNFLLWQLAYAEFVFLDVLWPDFTPADLDEAIRQFQLRNRRFGGI
ncbi:MAG: isoprenyl transferase [Oscillospiraceae bacterium]|nr:isoprenyl transferase [Oscillospiraceae bacterium]MBQ3241395.1 isoprenyl transferase [Oscillospiraceae bacterium]MBR2636921.1 isoprenyl transferase [Oscillospiraceae bacterium]